MGKRKKAAKKPTGPRKNEPLATTFACLFCNHEKSVIVQLDRKAGTGNLTCKVCGQNYQCPINYLSAAVDVYSDWVDACEVVANENDDKIDNSRTESKSSAYQGTARRQESEDHEQSGYEGDGIVADDEYD